MFTKYFAVFFLAIEDISLVSLHYNLLAPETALCHMLLYLYIYNNFYIFGSVVKNEKWTYVSWSSQVSSLPTCDEGNELVPCFPKNKISMDNKPNRALERMR